MSDKEFVLDVKGNKVYVGDIVKVLEIDKKITPEDDELERVMSMVGEELEVDDIDKFGCAWVTKWFRIGNDDTEGHGIALEPNQMELVRSSNGS